MVSSQLQDAKKNTMSVPHVNGVISQLREGDIRDFWGIMLVVMSVSNAQYCNY